MELIYILIGIMVGAVTGYVIRDGIGQRRETRAYAEGMKAGAKIFQALLGLKEDTNDEEMA